MAMIRHGETGKFVRSACPDDNCGGNLMAGQDRFGDPVWHCDGLTYRGDDGALLACPRELPRQGPTP